MKLNKIARFVFGSLVVSIISFTGNTTQAQQPQPQPEKVNFRYTTSCATRGTKWDGERYSCFSQWSRHTVPSNYVYKQNSLKLQYTSKNGSENACNVRWKDFVVINSLGDIKAPRTIEIQSYARSPKGKGGKGRGWSDCLYTGEYVKFK